ncbi:MAG: hypothetical protein OEZ10_07355 [Gammaproteobacteria bacterium]|nr:hypothetical protein [Gammaproteobacteria bacterium]
MTPPEARQTDPNILIIGYGEMGHAFEFLLGLHASLHIWHRHLDNADAQLRSWSRAASHIYFCLPATALARVSKLVEPDPVNNPVCAAIAKGLDDEGRMPVEILASRFSRRAGYGVIYGPMIAEEIVAGKPGFAHVAADNHDHARAIMRCFRHTALTLQPHDDMIGLSWSAIMKNVYAILFGLADGLGLGDNSRGALLVKTMAELKQVLQSVDAAPDSAWSLGGLGDLVTTATSAGSHHHELGLMLARGDTTALTGEGPHTIRLLAEKQLIDLAQFPLAQCVESILANPAPKTINQFVGILQS